MGIEDISAMKNGFIVVPFKLPDHKALPKSQEASLHFMFAKRHQSSNSNESDCLFLVNLPLLSNIEHMKKFVGQLCGKYDTVSHVEELLYNDEFGLHEVDLSALTSDLMSSTDVNEKRYTPRNTALLKFVDAASINNCWNALKNTRICMPNIQMNYLNGHIRLHHSQLLLTSTNHWILII